MTSRAFRAAALAMLVPFVGRPAIGADALTLNTPVPYQVVQRDAVEPGRGAGFIGIGGLLPDDVDRCAWEYRAVPIGQSNAEVAWEPAGLQRDGEQFATAARVAAGWYRLEFRGQRDGATVCAAAVEPVGVGEVFVVAGQSYATNTNEERHNVQDPQRRVAAYDSATGAWRVAYDPQPTPDGSDGGSIWPPLGDALAQEFNVPIGFANVAWGGTASKQWLPGEPLHQRLIETGRQLGRFRAVLWQQGESDVIAKTPTETTSGTWWRFAARPSERGTLSRAGCWRNRRTIPRFTTIRREKAGFAPRSMSW